MNERIKNELAFFTLTKYRKERKNKNVRNILNANTSRATIYNNNISYINTQSDTLSI